MSKHAGNMLGNLELWLAHGFKDWLRMKSVSDKQKLRGWGMHLDLHYFQPSQAVPSN